MKIEWCIIEDDNEGMTEVYRSDNTDVAFKTFKYLVTRHPEYTYDLRYERINKE